MLQASSLALEQAALATQSARVPKGSSLSITSKPSPAASTRRPWSPKFHTSGAPNFVVDPTLQQCACLMPQCSFVPSATSISASVQICLPRQLARRDVAIACGDFGLLPNDASCQRGGGFTKDADLFKSLSVAHGWIKACSLPAGFLNAVFWTG